ncbi:S-layer homology domain-containing protein [Subtercola endophyticus]|uniref:S-layer homology domain-containing protein n=1 Tax=Subtercola endophyticus TaxID=2895559 RepID=UPI001E28CE6E|nr:S-layer homology domain-containing protein [Subtercola endophyticus]UFS60859.1 S-layer homology domain-containing protein [Subtercola endophyticus]
MKRRRGSALVGIMLAAGLVLGTGALTATASDGLPDGSSASGPDSSVASIQAQQQAQLAVQAELAAKHPDVVSEAVPGGGASATAKLRTNVVTTGFSAGHIINDALFYSGSAMTASAVQTFLNGEGTGCTAGSFCLKNYKQTTTTRAADQMCGQYTGKPNETAAAIIAQVGQLCGISQKVLLALIQKESGLVDGHAPAADDYTNATGYGCPDTSGCDATYNGFYNQVYWAAWQFKRYLNPPGRTYYFTSYLPGTTVNVDYSPDSTCGAAPVTIQNSATAALYFYTPYQPNAAALAGTGDDCSSYGNLNFWILYTDWFGSTTAAPDQFFTDVPTNATFYPNIQWMARLGLTTGNVQPDGTKTYLPNDPVTRQAMAAFLFRYNGQPFTPPATPSFSDVTTANPFYSAIEWMKSAGISTGNADGTFHPNDPVTRQDMAAFLARYSKETLPNPANPSFTDVPANSVFYRQIEWMKADGISTGNADGTYAPLDPVTRQAMAAFLQRFYNHQISS